MIIARAAAGAHAWASRELSTLLPRDKKCKSNENGDTCEKPTMSSSKLLTIFVVVGVVVIAIFLGLLFYLHRRRQRMEREEDHKDGHELDDYGFDPYAPATGSQRQPQDSRPPPPYAPGPQGSNMPQMPAAARSAVNLSDMNGAAPPEKPPVVTTDRFSKQSNFSFNETAAPAVPRDALATK